MRMITPLLPRKDPVTLNEHTRRSIPKSLGTTSNSTILHSNVLNTFITEYLLQSALYISQRASFGGLSMRLILGGTNLFPEIINWGLEILG
jgi:hypothetical protein